MSSLPPKFFPFDGECALSKDGDLVLRTVDGSTLLTHVALMELVSPVLRTAVKDFNYGEGIEPEEDCKTWTLALNLMHPNGPNLHEDDVTTSHVFSVLEPLLQLGLKYSIDCIFYRVDEAFHRLCLKQSDRLCSRAYSHYVALNKVYDSAGDVQIDLFQFMFLSAKFDLSTSWLAFSDLASKHVEHVSSEHGFGRCSGNWHDSPRLEVDELISRLADAGCHAAGCSLALEVFKAMQVNSGSSNPQSSNPWDSNSWPENPWASNSQKSTNPWGGGY